MHKTHHKGHDKTGKIRNQKKKTKRTSRMDDAMHEPEDVSELYDCMIQSFLNHNHPKKRLRHEAAKGSELVKTLVSQSDPWWIVRCAPFGPAGSEPTCNTATQKRKEATVDPSAFGLSDMEHRMLVEFVTSEDVEEKVWLLDRFTPNLWSVMNDPCIRTDPHHDATHKKK